MSTVKSKKLQVGTDATSSNNFTIYQPATPDGTLRIGVGNADSPTEVGRFTSAGYKPQKPVAFTAYRSGTQTGLTNNTHTKIQCQNTEYDTDSSYDGANYKFQPTVAGYYQINGKVVATGTNLSYLIAELYKNGTQYKAGSYSGIQGGEYGSSVSSIVYMNGTTDYLELYSYASITSGTATVYGGGAPLAQTYMNGILIAQG